MRGGSDRSADEKERKKATRLAGETRNGIGSSIIRPNVRKVSRPLPHSLARHERDVERAGGLRKGHRRRSFRGAACGFDMEGIHQRSISMVH